VAPTITRQQRHRIIARLGAPSSQPTVSQQGQILATVTKNGKTFRASF
jgi:hypothetical protein